MSVATAPQDGREAPLGNTYETVKRSNDKNAGNSRLPGLFKLQRCSQLLRPKKRVAKCCRHSYGNGDVYGRTANGRAEFLNLLRCGSVWDCPVCARKVSGKRARIVLQGMEQAKAEGLRVDLLTLTVPHSLFQPCKQVLSGLIKARTHFKNSRAYKAYKLEAGWVGEIWASEVTLGRNGWHPHCHGLVFAEKSFLEDLRGQWTASVKHVGLGVVNTHGYRVDMSRDGDAAAQYVSKWGLESELTRADLKKSRFGGRTPFALLADYGKGDKEAGERFCEYSDAFHGRPQLLWTDGLKARFGVVDNTDQELAEQSEIEAEPGQVEDWVLDQAGWMLVLGANMRGELLKFAGMHGQAGVDALVAFLKGYPNIDDPHYYAHRCGKRSV